MNRSGWILLLIAALFISCNSKEGSLFVSKDSKETNITFQNNVASTDELNILDYLYFYNGGGVSVGDINNDGCLLYTSPSPRDA